MVDRRDSTDFWIQKFFWLGPFFDLFLIFVQTGVVFLPFHVRVKNGRHYSNFEKKNLKFEIYIIFSIYFQKITVRL